MNLPKKGPIKPEEVQDVKDSLIPEKVIEVFNDLIAENWAYTSSTFTQNEAIHRITCAMNITREEVYGRGWLNVEDIYRKVGWKVEYDKPGYNETYEATFTFRK